MIKRLLVLILLVSNGAAWAAMEDSPVAFELFRQKLHPLMFQYCQGCHSERAVSWPQGPLHSHSRAQVAFPTFLKYINWNEPEKSSLIKMAMNQHYCAEHGTNCKIADKVAKDTQMAVLAYMGDVKAAGVVAGASITPRISGRLTRVYANSSPLTVEPELGLPSIGEAQTLWYSLSKIMRGLTLEMILEKVGEGHYAVTSLRMRAPRKRAYIALQGLKLVINGQTLESSTGFETMDRVLMFSEFSDGSSQHLAIEKPTILIKPGDKIALSFDHAAALPEFPTRMCGDIAKFKDSVNQNLPDAQYAFQDQLAPKWVGPNYPSGRVSPTRDQDLCFAFESRINFARPRRSVLHEDLKPLGAVAAKSVSQFANMWINRAAD